MGAILNKDKETETDHSIRNLALLPKDANSILSNSVFEVKRQKLIELDREGKYVPVCTRNVFLKYYAEADAQQPHFWSDKDKISYFDEISKRGSRTTLRGPRHDDAHELFQIVRTRAFRHCH